jgi:hypothetical protein
VQHSLDEIEILYVPLAGSDASDESWRAVADELRKIFGPQLAVRHREVQSIPKKREGVKTPLIISKVPSTKM